MKPFVLIALLLVLPTSAQSLTQQSLALRIDDLSRQITSKATAKQKSTIAVVEFADLEGRITNFGRFLAEELITRLHETEKFKVIERQLLNKVINEQKLTLTGMVDPSSAKKLGNILGVDAIVSGSITDLGKTLRVNARMISTETGEIFAVASSEIPKDDQVITLVGGGDQVPTQSSRTSGPESKTKGSTQTVKASLYTFELQQCQLSGSTVVCDLMITNNDADRLFSYDNLVGGAGMIDNLGANYRATSVQIANRSGFEDATIPSNVPTRSRVIFDNVSPQAVSIALLRMQFNRFEAGIIKSFRIEFRDVTLSK